ncbi:MAG: DUF1995 family protein [Cyanobacteria bacterium P01_E01_bin.45]
MPDPVATSTSDPSSNRDKQPVPLPELPDDFSGAQAQALTAVQAALEAGYNRLQVEILAPDLKPDVLAYPFHQVFGAPFGFAFADAGAAALAKYRWEQPDWMVCGIREAGEIDDTVPLIFSMPTLVEIEAVEQLCDRRNSNVSTNKSTDVPVLVINPILQDTGTAGVGLSGRRLRERFISTLEPCYFLQSLGSGALFRMFPHPWTVWELTEAGQYQILATLDSKPSGEQLAQLFAGDEPESIWSGLKRFIRALQN